MIEAGHSFWYMTRAAGLLAYLLLFASVALGLVMTTSAAGGRVPRYRIYDLHRFLSLLTLGVTLFHVFIVLPDGFIGFTLRELLVPFASPYEPFYMGVGQLSAYGLGVVIGSFYLQPRLPYNAWRIVHYATFGVFVLALAHGIGSGTDTGTSWADGLYIVTGVAFFLLVMLRVLFGAARAGRPSRDALQPSAKTPVATSG